MDNQPPQIVSPIQNYQQQAPAQVPQAAGMFERRIGNLGFLLGFFYWGAIIVVPALLQFSVHAAVNGSGAQIPGALTSFINIVSLLVGLGAVGILLPVIISLYVRRLHDANQSGLLTLLLLVPFGGLFLFLYCLFVPGTLGPNKYGEPVDSYDYWVVLGFKKPSPNYSSI